MTAKRVNHVMSVANECKVTFPVRHGVFGVDRLAARLNALAIAEWHPGRWVDWHHAAIEIDFGSAADAALAKSACYDPASDSP